MKRCYLCDSPVEYSAVGVSVIINCQAQGPEDSEIVCSNCTNVLQEVTKRIRRSGVVLVRKLPDGILKIEEQTKYKIMD